MTESDQSLLAATNCEHYLTRDDGVAIYKAPTGKYVYFDPAESVWFANKKGKPVSTSSLADALALIGVKAPPPGTTAASSNLEQPELDYGQVPWFVEIMRDREDIRKTDEVEDIATDGQRIYRVAGKPGLSFTRVSMTSGGKRVISAETGGELRAEFDIVSVNAGTFNCVYCIDFYGLDAKPVARVKSAVDTFQIAAGGHRSAEVNLSPLLLGGGTFLVSFSIYDASAATDTSAAADRYELLTRSFQVEVRVPTDSDPPSLHYPAQWLFGDSETPVPSILRGA